MCKIFHEQSSSLNTTELRRIRKLAFFSEGKKTTTHLARWESTKIQWNSFYHFPYLSQQPKNHKWMGLHTIVQYLCILCFHLVKRPGKVMSEMISSSHAAVCFAHFLLLGCNHRWDLTRHRNTR